MHLYLKVHDLSKSIKQTSSKSVHFQASYEFLIIFFPQHEAEGNMNPTFAFSGHVTAAVASRLVVAPPFVNTRRVGRSIQSVSPSDRRSAPTPL